MIAEWVIVNCLKDVLTPGDYIVCNYHESPEEVYQGTLYEGCVFDYDDDYSPTHILCINGEPIQINEDIDVNWFKNRTVIMKEFKDKYNGN